MVDPSQDRDVLAERNREVIAERLNWPSGALDAVRELEKRYPGWWVYYSRGGRTSDPDAGFKAVKRSIRNAPTLFGRTAEGLAVEIENYVSD